MITVSTLTTITTKKSQQFLQVLLTIRLIRIAIRIILMKPSGSPYTGTNLQAFEYWGVGVPRNM